MDGYKEKYEDLMIKLIKLMNLDNLFSSVNEQFELTLVKLESLHNTGDELYNEKFKLESIEKQKRITPRVFLTIVLCLISWFILCLGSFKVGLLLNISTNLTVSLGIFLSFVSNYLEYYFIYKKKSNDEEYLYGQLRKKEGYNDLLELIKDNELEIDKTKEESEILSQKMDELSLKMQTPYNEICACLALYSFLDSDELASKMVTESGKSDDYNAQIDEERHIVSRLIRRRNFQDELRNIKKREENYDMNSVSWI